MPSCVRTVQYMCTLTIRKFYHILSCVFLTKCITKHRVDRSTAIFPSMSQIPSRKHKETPTWNQHLPCDKGTSFLESQRKYINRAIQWFSYSLGNFYDKQAISYALEPSDYSIQPFQASLKTMSVTFLSPESTIPQVLHPWKEETKKFQDPARVS